MELVVISGKGGTGKTSIAISLAELEKNCTKVDCDVDAPNFHLFYSGENITNEEFYAGKEASIDNLLCSRCGLCSEVCVFDAIKDYKVNSMFCEGCGACKIVCPREAIKLEDKHSATIFTDKYKDSTVIRAKMDFGADGSGKIVTLLRNKARELDEKDRLRIVDASPGIGCAVIASITGSGNVLAVTEATVSGFEDLKRIIHLCRHFNIKPMVCINKYDINIEISKDIERYISDAGLELVGTVPYDTLVSEAINSLNPVVNYSNSKAGEAIKDMHRKIKNILRER